VTDERPDISNPRAIRAFSILPDEDSDEAYCVRHARDMLSFSPVIHSQGALYTTTDDFSIYTCPSCLHEAAKERENGPWDLFNGHVIAAFGQWDAGEAFGEWFTYLGEGEPADIDAGRVIDIGEVDSEGGGGL